MLLMILIEKLINLKVKMKMLKVNLKGWDKICKVNIKEMFLICNLRFPVLKDK